MLRTHPLCPAVVMTTLSTKYRTQTLRHSTRYVQGMVRNMVRKMAWGELPLFSVEHLNPSISFPSTEFKSQTTLWVMRASGNSRLPASVSARVAASCQFDFSTLSANAGSRLSQELLDCLD